MACESPKLSVDHIEAQVQPQVSCNVHVEPRLRAQIPRVGLLVVGFDQPVLDLAGRREIHEIANAVVKPVTSARTRLLL